MDDQERNQGVSAEDGFHLEKQERRYMGETTMSEEDWNQAQEAMAEYPSGKKQGEYTVADYRALPEDCPAELIDGTFFYMEAPHARHQAVASELSARFRDYIVKNGGKCRTWGAPVNVQLDCDDKTMVQPDVIILCDKRKMRDGSVFGAPDLVAEVLSDSTARIDRVVKKEKYRKAGVREYWMVDRMFRKVMVCHFEKGEADRIYGPDEEVPVGIYDGKCRVNFREIFDYAEEW